MTRKIFDTMGLNTRIGMVDTAMYPLFDHVETHAFGVKDRERFIRSHATKMASIIASRDRECPGIAPQATLIVCEAISPTGSPMDRVDDALRWLLDQRIDVLCLCFAVARIEESTRGLLQSHLNNNTIIFAAHNPQLPALASVPGVLMTSGSGAHIQTQRSWRTRLDKVELVSGSSVSCALASGYAACIRSAYPDITRQELVGLLPVSNFPT